MNSYSTSIIRLQNILETLRVQCPWDKKQTIDSLKTQTIEELYELTEAISNHDWPNIKEELGDLLMHLMFYSLIAKEQNQFEFGDVIASVCDKLVYRHPHIYANIIAENEEVVKQNWEKLKLKEGKKSILEGVPNGLPSLIKSYRLQAKAALVGFDWPNAAMVRDKILEEWNEVEEAIAEKTHDDVIEEMGDLLFVMVNYARKLNIDPDTALEMANKKFKRRFEFIETHVPNGIQNADVDTMEIYWQKAKSEGL